MPHIRVYVDSDRTTARRVMTLHHSGRFHHESREAARAEARRQGWTIAADPVFVGTTNGSPTKLMYEVEIVSDTAV